MAHSPEKRAQVLMDIAGGMPINRAYKVHGVDRKTIRGWLDSLDGSPQKTPQRGKAKSPSGDGDKKNSPPGDSPLQLVDPKAAAEFRREEFVAAVEMSMIEVVGSVGKMLRIITDPEFAKLHAAYLPDIFNAVHERASGVLELAQRVIEGQRKSDSAGGE